MDKILNRKLFRQKYLDLVGVKNLPKFAVGGQGIASLEPSQDQLAAMNTKLEEASTPKKTASNETFMGFGGKDAAVSADQARLNILLPIAAQLMAGTVRPGQSSISGLIESAGKGLSTVGTNILAMKEMDLKKRKEDREATAAPKSSLETKSVRLNFDIPGIGKKGEEALLLKSDIAAYIDYYKGRGTSPFSIETPIDEALYEQSLKDQLALQKEEQTLITDTLVRNNYAFSLTGDLINKFETTVATTGFLGEITENIAGALGAFKGTVDRFGNGFTDQVAGYKNRMKPAVLGVLQSDKKMTEEEALEALEGGRFSVTDIELALRSIGDTSNKKVALAKLRETQRIIASRVRNTYFATSYYGDKSSSELAKFDARYARYHNYLIGKKTNDKGEVTDDSDDFMTDDEMNQGAK